LLFYDRSRFYDPALGRYISLDRIGVAVDLSIYLYAAAAQSVVPIRLSDVGGPYSQSSPQ